MSSVYSFSSLALSGQPTDHLCTLSWRHSTVWDEGKWRKSKRKRCGDGGVGGVEFGHSGSKHRQHRPVLFSISQLSVVSSGTQNDTSLSFLCRTSLDSGEGSGVYVRTQILVIAKSRGGLRTAKRRNGASDQNTRPVLFRKDWQQLSKHEQM